MKEYDIIIKELMKINRNQMIEEEYRYIADKLGDKNFLIFGTGRDSNLWRFANKRGLNVFLENNPEWITNDSDIYLVNYTTRCNQAEEMLNNYINNGDVSKLKMDIPEFIYNIKWDYIFVDSPVGYESEKVICYGRMQSIYMSKLLSTPNHTEVFLHDCNRWIEDVYGKTFLGEEYVQLKKLRHFKLCTE